MFDRGEEGKLDKTIELKTVRISSRLAMEDSYIHQERDSDLRYLPRNDSENNPHDELASVRAGVNRVGSISHCSCVLASRSV